MESYETIGILGEGTYGVVVKARHRATGRLVAIKKFKQTEDDDHVRKTSLREVRVLKQLHHPNVVALLDVFRRDGKLYLVFEYIENTILQLLEHTERGLSPGDVQRFTYQLLRGIDYCHAHNIIHRDVKPENILISSQGILKLCDFGFARHMTAKGKYTDYVATRWYRAPELLVGEVSYGKAVDIWAVGCIFAELTDTRPLFPGDSDLGQLHLILRTCGAVPAYMVQLFERNPLYKRVAFPRPGQHRTLQQRYNKQSAEWLEFLTLCLRTDPAERPSCAELMNLPYFTKDNFRVNYEAELRQLTSPPSAAPSARERTSRRGSVAGGMSSAAPEASGASTASSSAKVAAKSVTSETSESKPKGSQHASSTVTAPTSTTNTNSSTAVTSHRTTTTTTTTTTTSPSPTTHTPTTATPNAMATTGLSEMAEAKEGLDVGAEETVPPRPAEVERAAAAGEEQGKEEAADDDDNGLLTATVESPTPLTVTPNTNDEQTGLNAVMARQVNIAVCNSSSNNNTTVNDLTSSSSNQPLHHHHHPHHDNSTDVATVVVSSSRGGGGSERERSESRAVVVDSLPRLDVGSSQGVNSNSKDRRETRLASFNPNTSFVPLTQNESTSNTYGKRRTSRSTSRVEDSNTLTASGGGGGIAGQETSAATMYNNNNNNSSPFLPSLVQARTPSDETSALHVGHSLPAQSFTQSIGDASKRVSKELSSLHPLAKEEASLSNTGQGSSGGHTKESDKPSAQTSPSTNPITTTTNTATSTPARQAPATHSNYGFQPAQTSSNNNNGGVSRTLPVMHDRGSLGQSTKVPPLFSAYANAPDTSSGGEWGNTRKSSNPTGQPSLPHRNSNMNTSNTTSHHGKLHGRGDYVTHGSVDEKMNEWRAAQKRTTAALRALNALHDHAFKREAPLGPAMNVSPVNGTLFATRRGNGPEGANVGAGFPNCVGKQLMSLQKNSQTSSPKHTSMTNNEAKPRRRSKEPPAKPTPRTHDLRGYDTTTTTMMMGTGAETGASPVPTTTSSNALLDTSSSLFHGTARLAAMSLIPPLTSSLQTFSSQPHAAHNTNAMGMTSTRRGHNGVEGGRSHLTPQGTSRALLQQHQGGTHGQMSPVPREGNHITNNNSTSNASRLQAARKELKDLIKANNGTTTLDMARRKEETAASSRKSVPTKTQRGVRYRYMQVL